MVLSGPVYSMEVKRLGHYEKTVARKFAQSVFISSEETQLFRRRVTDRPVAVIPHGVDLDFFHRNGTAYIKDSHKRTIVFAAAMDYFPNIDEVQNFCQNILPRIAESVPGVSFAIVGRKPDRKVL